MRFAHLSDTHLGFRQYGIYERETDFYRAFERVVSKIIEERPDFVIHSGDMFDSPKPPPRAIWVAHRALSRLKEKNIPVYAITGNHDMLFRRGAMPPQMLLRDAGVRLLSEEEPFVVHKGIFIGGVPYFSGHSSESLKEILSMLSEKSKAYRKSIVMIHQGIDRYLPKGYELLEKDIPKGFSYYAMGHIHSRIKERFGKGMLVYPGSTELWSANEYDDYRSRGKGFTLVDMSRGEPDAQHIDVPLEREIIRKRIKGDAEKALAALEREISVMPQKPLLYLEVADSAYERSALHELINSRLSSLVIGMRTSFVSSLKETVSGSISRELSIPQMDDILREMLGDRKKADFASMLYKTLSSGNVEKAVEGAERFYRGMK
ncbi:MAG: DNA repair exonuclease [Candidatus Aenigmarchaeota archaeon]|nr:DNA repair exonuclease [Candidatus Aenigmarchaeota archaeon]